MTDNSLAGLELACAPAKKDSFDRSRRMKSPARVPHSFGIGRWECALALLFFVSRLSNLTLAGLGYDEATYLHWGQLIATDWNQRFVGAGVGGKQPLHAWAVALSERLLADPVLAGRLVSVFTGGLTLVAVWLVARRLFSRRVAAVAALLYIVCPFTLTYDRVAFIDSMLAAEAAWMLYLSVRLVDRQEFLPFAGLAISFGAAMLTKSVGTYLVLLFPAALLATRPGQASWGRVARWLLAVLLGVAVGYGIYHYLFGADQAATAVAKFEEKYGQYTMSPSYLLTFPWVKWMENAAQVRDWSLLRMTVPLTLAALAALLSASQYGRKAYLLAAWTLVPIAGQVLVASVFYDRYILFSIPPLLVLIAAMLIRVTSWIATRCSAVQEITLLRRWPANQAMTVAFLAVLLIQPAWLDFQMITNLKAANGALGGFYGLEGLRQYLTERVLSNPTYVANPIVVVIAEIPGPIQDGSAVLLSNVPHVKVLRVALFPPEGKLTIFDPSTRKPITKDYFRDREVYFVDDDEAETKSLLAGHLESYRKFSNMRSYESAETNVRLFKIKFDDSFQ